MPAVSERTGEIETPQIRAYHRVTVDVPPRRESLAQDADPPPPQSSQAKRYEA
jgi:hypothetical protein